MEQTITQTSLEKYFSDYRSNIIGVDTKINTPFINNTAIIYTDWTASGRCYAPIENKLTNELMPFMANTHTDTNHTGMTMTYAYHKAQKIIKKHVNAGENDVLIACGSGMTGVVNKFQRILGLKSHESFKSKISFTEEDKPIIFITHMEHHSNQTSWLETFADVVVVTPTEDGLVCPENFKKAFAKYPSKKNKIAAITSCSNVTGIMTPYHKIAKEIHAVGGLCFVDFACSAPYVDINMHPTNENEYLDAVFFSPHKFLGGPGSSGILIFDKKLYKNTIPDNPGGGTVDWTNPWGGHKYVNNIEEREDGGTPPFMQTIKAAMAMRLKEQMSVSKIQEREEELLNIVWDKFDTIDNLHVLAGEHKKRLGVISFYIDNLHFNVGVKMLNDKFGIQTRGGCSCAGTYGHYLLSVNEETSNQITSEITQGNCSSKPGWIRMSIHPTQTNEEIQFVVDAIKSLAENHTEWIKNYNVDLASGKIVVNKKCVVSEMENFVDNCFNLK